jgi:hypothetical protein
MSANQAEKAHGGEFKSAKGVADRRAVMPESFLGALNLVVQFIAQLPAIVEGAADDASDIATWGEDLLELTVSIRATVEVPSDLQRRVHWDQFLHLAAELGRAAQSVPETLDLTPLVELEPPLVSEIDAIQEGLPPV